MLTLTTSTRGDGPGAFENNLSPQIQLYGPAENLVATGALEIDGRNETINYPPLAAGVYGIDVTAKNGTQGEYFLSTAWTPVPTVTGLSPATGPVGGGTTVTITGSGLGDATTVDFGNTPAASFVVSLPRRSRRQVRRAAWGPQAWP